MSTNVTEPGSPKAELLERERRLLKPAGIAAFAGVLLLIASIAATRVGLKFPRTDADQLTLFHQHSGRLVAAAAVGSVGFALLAAPLFVLFQAAAARTERIRRSFLPFVIIGPILFGVQGVILASGLKSAGSKFAREAPAVEAKARQGAVATGGTAKATTSTQTSTGTTPSTSAPATPDQAASTARDNLAKDLVKNERAIKTSNYLGLVVALTLLFAVIYTALWGMRTGLLTRGAGGLGMGSVLVLFFVPFFGPIPLMIWFLGLGMLFTGWRRAPRPPAWEAGEAIPWPPTARQQARMGGGTIAGTGREVDPTSGESPPGQIDSGGIEAEAEPGSPEADDERQSDGQRRTKRKRRR